MFAQLKGALEELEIDPEIDPVRTAEFLLFFSTLNLLESLDYDIEEMERQVSLIVLWAKETFEDDESATRH
tara:strand:+ start:754 stop:966 length:213 start_codon:yes stop_codon:yes gene_type:complete